MYIIYIPVRQWCVQVHCGFFVVVVVCFVFACGWFVCLGKRSSAALCKSHFLSFTDAMPLLSDVHAAPPATEIEEHTPLQAGAALYPALPQPYPGSYGVPEQPPPYAPPPYEHHDYPTKVWAHPSLSGAQDEREQTPTAKERSAHGSSI